LKTFESDAVSVQIRKESVAAGECYRPHAERGGRGGIFSAVVDENAILRWEPFESISLKAGTRIVREWGKLLRRRHLIN
jgi:hypothetical protein